MTGTPIRALLLDIDGTLLPQGRVGVSQPIIDRVRRMRNDGVTIVVATGRSGFVIGPALLGSFEADYYICSNGAEVLDADAFSVFKAHGVFDPATAASFRDNILKRGGTENPMVLYKRFRGGEPTIEALMRRDGIIK